MEAWVLLVGVTGLLMNGVIIYLTIKYNRKHTKLAEDQLDLARQQAAVRPKVEFLTAYLSFVFNKRGPKAGS